MGEWKKIVKSNAVKILREVCCDFGIDIQFYDEYCNPTGNDVAFVNPVCHIINTTKEGKKSCILCYKKNLKEFDKSHKPFKFECYAGLHSIAIPIFNKEKYYGSLICSGMLLPKSKTSMHRYCFWELTRLGIDKTVAQRHYNQLRIINTHSEEYIFNFLKKIVKDIEFYLETLREKTNLIKKNKAIVEAAYNRKYASIIGKSPQMKKVFETLDLIEDCDSPVLIEGETGTGKELISAAIHYNSTRKSRAYVTQNCSAFSETLLTSELFGHEKGAFTGAIAEKKGLFEIADRGTLLLDEIGDMNINIQARLLRILEDGIFYSVGGTERKQVDVRIISATNKNLRDLVAKGLFRKDLFYRINVVTITLPPLRERKEDIIPLSNYFLKSFVENNYKEEKYLGKDVIAQFMAYEWPGNVRELKNTIERLIVLSGSQREIKSDLIPTDMNFVRHPRLHEGNSGSGSKLQDYLQFYEKRITEDVLERTGWNKTAASKELGISRASLNNIIKRCHIIRGHNRDSDRLLRFA